MTSLQTKRHWDCFLPHRHKITCIGYSSEETDYLYLQKTSWRCKQEFPWKHCYPDHKFSQPTPHHICSPLWNTEAKNTVDASWRKNWITVPHCVLNRQCMMCVAALCTVLSYGLYCLSNGTRKQMDITKLKAASHSEMQNVMSSTHMDRFTVNTTTQDICNSQNKN